jgi:DEAD/DEAH box helicase domain-containing protein
MSIAATFAAVDLDTLLPPSGAQYFEIGSELDCNLCVVRRLCIQDFRGTAGEIRRPATGGHRKGGLPGLIRFLASGGPSVDRHNGEVFSQTASTGAALIIETRPLRTNGLRGAPWQLAHDWRNAADQKAVIELFGKLRDVDTSLRQKDVPHGRYLDIDFADGSAATMVLDQGFGAWGRPSIFLFGLISRPMPQVKQGGWQL